MVKYSYERRLKNGTLIGIYVGAWYVGMKLVFPDRAGRPAAWKGWLFGWYPVLRWGIWKEGWKFNFGKFAGEGDDG